jgi:hypothetical protein
MMDRPTLTKIRATKEPASDRVTGQGNPSFHQFLLKVDGQTKDSFTTFETAEKIGLKIKKAYPVVQVSVYDTVQGQKTIIGAGKE